MKKPLIALIIIIAVILGGWYGTFSLRRTKAENYLAAGNQHFEEESDRKAIIEYKKAAFIFPTADIYFALGEIYFLNQNLSRAETYFKKAVKKDPYHPKAIFGLSETYFIQEKNDEALETLQKNNLTDALIKVGLSRILLSQKKDRKAQEALRGCEEKLCQFYQAKVLLYQEKYSEVKDKIQKITPEGKQSVRTMILTEPEEKDLKVISEAASQSAKISRAESHQVIFAEALNQTGDPATALPILKRIVEQNSTYRDAFVFLGHSLILINKYEEAKDMLLKAKDLDPVYSPTWLYLGKAYKGLDNQELADACYERAKKMK